MSESLFAGRGALRRFLDPTKMTFPIVEVPQPINLYAKERVRIYAVIGCQTPLLNVKLLPALNMLLEAEESGRLEGVHTIVEATSGNTGIGLKMVADAFGIPNVVAYMKMDDPYGKIAPLEFRGVRVEKFTEKTDEPTTIERARSAGQEPGWFNPDQYSNDANWRAYEKWLAPGIWQSFAGKLTVMCVGLGTGGTAIGLSRYLKRQSPPPVMIGVICTPGKEGAVPGVRSLENLAKVSLDSRSALDAEPIEAGFREHSYAMSRRLWSAVGSPVGPSSGFALVGLLKYLATVPNFDELRNSDGEVVAAFVCPDTALPYWDKYTTILDSVDFA